MLKEGGQIKYFLYCRKSTDEKDRQIYSIQSQIDALKELAQKSGIKIIKVFTESKSAKAPGREQFGEMLKEIQANKGMGILCWKLDRLARNPSDEGQIKWLLQQGIIQNIKTPERDYWPSDNVLITSVEFGMANQYIRDLSTNVKRGMNRKANFGWRPGRAPLGYLNSRTKLKGEQDILIDPKLFLLVKKLFQHMLTGNYTVSALLELANEKLSLVIPATKKKPSRKICLSELFRILSNPFYYGWFEWPKGSNNWIKGKHEPMITKDEFDRVQIILGRGCKSRIRTNNFAFRGLMRCGSCGGMITAESKVKNQKNGNIHNYVYYHCTKKKNKNCPEKVIELEALNEWVRQYLQRLTISEEFKNWAISYLRKIHSEDKKVQDITLENKQKELAQISEHLNNLSFQYTSPKNRLGELISDDDYKNTKTRLLKDRIKLEEELKNCDKNIDLELSERTFNFACYASIWFEKGDDDIKRAIFSCLGSNLLLTRKTLKISHRKPFEILISGLPSATQEFAKFEPLKMPMNTGDFFAFVDRFVLMSG